MSKNFELGRFKTDPNCDEYKYLMDEVTAAYSFLNEKLNCIDKITDKSLQLISMFALIDCLAQEQANYPARSKTAFCAFVLKNQRQCNYMEAVDPVTLYYDVEDLIDAVENIPGFPPAKEITVDELGPFNSIEDVIYSKKAQTILDYCRKKKGDEFSEKKAQQHRLISLIYRMRDKAVHEISGLGESIPAFEEIEQSKPYYRSVERSYVEHDGRWVSDFVVELVIPNSFVRNILADCIEGYLEECINKQRIPFSNNHIARRHKLSWYDKE